MTLRSMLKRPSAFVPLIMSGLALATLAVAFASHGLQRQPDEGAAAHIWQLMMAGQLPVMAVFALRWIPKSPRQGAAVLGMQIFLALCAAAPVLILGL